MADSPRIALTYSVDLEFAPGDEAWLEASCGLESVDAVEAACAEAGFEVWRMPVDHDLAALVQSLAARRPDAVFSMVESVRNDARLEPAMVYLLEWLGIPYTGAPPLALSLALHKPHARAVLAAAGVPVPIGAVVEDCDAPLSDGLRYPLIVKPAREDGSMGISSASVVWDEESVRERVRFVSERFSQPALVEEFADGREFPVSLLGEAEPEILPLREIAYDLPAGLPRLLSYEAKWVEGSPEYGGTPVAAAADMDEKLAHDLRSMARAAYSAVGLRDYGRVDIRLHPTDGPVVVDVNPNPELLPGHGGIAGAALDAGMSFVELVRFIVERALERGARHA